MANIIKYEGELDINGFKIPCYVLEDGTRVLSTTGLQKSLGVIDNEPKQRSSGRLNEILDSEALKPHLSRDSDTSKYNPIICLRGKQKISAYKATILPDICEAILLARDSGLMLGKRQKIVAIQAEVIIRSLAKVGIIALVDEATGYQYDRERYELQKILKAFIAEELLPWQKRFPDVYYKELFRLNGWEFTVHGIKKRPGVIGTWTNKLVYEQLPKGVLDELKRRTPKGDTGKYLARFHQNLTLDIGEPNLTQQLNQIITLFQLSDNMMHMWQQFEKLKLRQSGQLELPFIFDEKGYTKEITNEK